MRLFEVRITKILAVTIQTTDAQERDWLLRNGFDGLVECRTCQGDGYSICDCCGHDNECYDCDGEGYLSDYRNQLRRDQEKLDKWTRSFAQPEH